MYPDLIFIQQEAASRSGLGKIHGSGSSVYGCKTLLLTWRARMLPGQPYRKCRLFKNNFVIRNHGLHPDGIFIQQEAGSGFGKISGSGFSEYHTDPITWPTLLKVSRSSSRPGSQKKVKSCGVRLVAASIKGTFSRHQSPKSYIRCISCGHTQLPVFCKQKDCVNIWPCKRKV